MNDNGEFDQATEPFAWTDDTGYYVIPNLSLSQTETYRVRIEVPTGWEQTAPLIPGTYHEVVLPQNTDVYQVDFGINYSDSILDMGDDSVTTQEDTPVTIDAISLDGTTLYFSRAAGAAHGTVNWTGTAIEYDPDPDWYGQDSFTYAMTPADGTYFQATVTVEVLSVNDAPEIVSEFRTRDGLELSGTLATEVENDDMTAVHFFGVEHGSFDMDDDGSFTYTPEAGFVGIETIWVNYVDEHGASSGDTEVSIAVCESAVGIDVQREEEVRLHEDPAYAALGYVATDSSDDLLIVGSPNSNRAFIYRETSDGWELEATLQGAAGSINFGSDVAIRGTTAVVGACLEDVSGDTDMGAVYVFEYTERHMDADRQIDAEPGRYRNRGRRQRRGPRP